MAQSTTAGYHAVPLMNAKPSTNGLKKEEQDWLASSSFFPFSLGFFNTPVMTCDSGGFCFKGWRGVSMPIITSSHKSQRNIKVTEVTVNIYPSYDILKYIDIHTLSTL